MRSEGTARDKRSTRVSTFQQLETETLDLRHGKLNAFVQESTQVVLHKGKDEIDLSQLPVVIGCYGVSLRQRQGASTATQKSTARERGEEGYSVKTKKPAAHKTREHNRPQV